MFVQENVELYIMLYAFVLTAHFLCEYVLVWPYEYENGHIYKHPGNALHTLTHITVMLTVFVLLLGFSNFIAVLVLLSGIVHYHLTWITLKALKSAKESGYFRRLFDAEWWIVGFNQWAHNMTYCVILLTLHKRDDVAAYFMCSTWPSYINQIGTFILN